MRSIFLPSLLIILLSSCLKNVRDQEPGGVEAYVPIYADLSLLQSVSVEPAQPTIRAGKIYAYGNYIFQNDANKGIHIIDDSPASQPKKVAFLKIPYNTEIAVKGSYLYANCIDDLLVFNLQNPATPLLEKRVKAVFPLINQQYPPFLNVYFVCADPQKGIVVDWQLQPVKNPFCKR